MSLKYKFQKMNLKKKDNGSIFKNKQINKIILILKMRLYNLKKILKISMIINRVRINLNKMIIISFLLGLLLSLIHFY